MANAQCSMPNVQRPMFNDQCSMSNIQCPMPHIIFPQEDLDYLFAHTGLCEEEVQVLLESSGFRNQSSLINQISQSIKSNESKTKIPGNTNESFTETKNISVQDKTLDDVELQRTFWN